jgi:hypothetical protein
MRQASDLQVDLLIGLELSVYRPPLKGADPDASLILSVGTVPDCSRVPVDQAYR